MSDDPGERPEPTAGSAEEQFTVPVPAATPRPPAASSPPSPGTAATQALPVAEPTRELPSLPPPPAGAVRSTATDPSWAAPSAPAGSAWPAPTGPAVPGPPPIPPNPYAGQPVWPAGARREQPREAQAQSTSSAPGALGSDDVDPLLAQIGTALFWITVGWWAFFLIRLIGWFARYGVTETMVISTIDLGAEETVIAAVLSVLAALLLLLGRGRNGRTPLGYASAGLAVVTVAIAIWRLIP